jgi:hypothetical protein
MMRRLGTMSSPLASALLWLFSHFWCLDNKGEEESYLYHFFIVFFISLVCNGHV